MHQQHTAFENIVGKGEIARNEQLLLFPQCFRPNQITVSPLVHIFYILSFLHHNTVKSKSLLNDKFLDWCEFKAFADNEINVKSRNPFYNG